MRRADTNSFLIWSSFVALACIVLLFSYWGFRPYEIYTDVQQPYRILNKDKTAEAGRPIIVQQKYCKVIDRPAKITIILEDGYYEVIRVIETKVNIGCYDRASQSAVIPFYTEEGRYRIRYRIQVQVNPIREETMELVTEYFNVVPSSIFVKPE